MRWLSRPDRRELLLVLFSLSVYLFAFNFESSLNYVGLDQSTVFQHLGLRSTKVLGRDGRKPPGWRDRLELEIFGSWGWEEGQVAGDGTERSQRKGSGRHGAQWVRRDTVEDLKEEDPSVNHARLFWGSDIPQTKVVKHVPGYTIVDNLFLYNNTVYLVTDDQTSLPPVKSIMESTGTGFEAWKVLSTQQGRQLMGEYGGVVRGVSWLAGDTNPYNLTLFDFWRLHSSLDLSIDADGRTTLSPPHRLIYPHNRFFTDPNPPHEKHWIRRQRFETGLHPYLIKAAFPHLTVQFYEDWEDYRLMGVPFVFERMMISDRKAAAASLQQGQPVNSPVFNIEASRWWWEPIRRTLALYFDRLIEEGEEPQQGFFHLKGGPKKVITFIDNQEEGAKDGLQAVLVPGDHDNLLRALRKLAREKGYEFHVVSTNLKKTSWNERLDTIVRSTIVLGVHGQHLLDAVWMRPSSKATLMELFPKKEFVSTREIVTRSIGLNYVAWWGKEQFSGESLPKPTEETNYPVNVDVDAVVTAVHTILSKEEAL